MEKVFSTVISVMECVLTVLCSDVVPQPVLDTWRRYAICQHLNEEYLLTREGMDDDVMDQQKYASAAMVLAKALVDQEKEMERTYDPERGHILPEIPLHKAREVMTRADFIQVNFSLKHTRKSAPLT